MGGGGFTRRKFTLSVPNKNYCNMNYEYLNNVRKKSKIL